MVQLNPSATSTSTSTSVQPYSLGRGYTSASRLNYQHYLWHSLLSFNIHPHITQHLDLDSSSNPVHIAELACGTAIWATDIARQYPSVQITASDISFEQCPPSAWLPSNISLREWDLFGNIPDEWVGAFDIVHVRLIQLILADGKLVPTLLKKMAQMLKPGGWIQWDESFTSQPQLLCPDGEENCPPSLRGLSQLLATVPTAWIGALDQAMRDVGLEQAEISRFDDELWIARAFFGMYMTMEEERAIETKGRTKELDEFLDRIKQLWRDSRSGNIVCSPKIVAIGQKPASA